MYEQIQEATRAIQQKWPGKPKIGIILGTGLGALAEEVESAVKIPYEEIPHFPHSTVKSHAGRFVCGNLSGKPVVAMEGRFHFYEGYSLQQITLPVRVMKALGCEILIVSNACGGMNPQYGKGDLMIIEDHINLIGDNPLIGKNDDRLGPRFPDMCWPYDRELIKLAQRNCSGRENHLPQGRFCGGFRAEPRDAGGVSLSARHRRRRGGHVHGAGSDRRVHAGLRTLGISVITDICLADALQPVSLEEILETAAVAEKKLRTLVRRVVAQV